MAASVCILASCHRLYTGGKPLIVGGSFSEFDCV